MRAFKTLTALGGLILIAGVAGAVPPPSAEAPTLEELKADYRRPTEIPSPPENLYTPARAELGKMLFFDPRLSGSGALSCASCHNPALSWSDGLKTGIGHMGTRLARHSPTIENLAWGGPYFWDGRAETLEDQATGPIQAEAEMNMPAALVVGSVASTPGYRVAFARAYPGEAISLDTIGKAIANYERTIVSGQAPFDRWTEGAESAIGEDAKRGFILFNTKADCAVCHSGWRFTDDGFHDVGLKSKDKGRGVIVAGVPALQYAFKTPSLRNIALSSPYMHDGSQKTLLEVVDFYDRGFIKRPSLSPHIKRLGLSAQEKSDLVTFLETLTGDNTPVTLPNLPPRRP